MLAESIAREQALLPRYEELRQRRENVRLAHQALQILIGEEQRSAHRTHTAAAELEALRQRQQQLSSCEQALGELRQRHQQLLEQQNQLAALAQTEEKLTELGKNVQAAQTAYAGAQSFAQQTGEHFRRLDRAFLDGQAGLLAQTLVPGSPCPVCGSLHHPDPARPMDETPTEEARNRARDAADKAREAAEEAAGQAAALLARQNSARADRDRQAAALNLTQTAGLAAAQAETRQQLDALAADIRREEVHLREKKKLEEQRPDREQALNDMQTALQTLRQNMARQETQALLLEQESQTLADSLPHRDDKTARQALAVLREELSAMETALTRAQEQLRDADGDIRTLQAQQEALTRQLADQPSIDTEEETAALAHWEEQAQELTAQQLALHHRLSTNRAALAGIRTTLLCREETEEKRRWLKALSDTANGTVTGKDRLTLETYVQTAYFDRVLHRANRRLAVMTGGQYDLKRREEAEGSRKMGLELNVVDHYNGSERSVKTLSGGEAFLASLALALGLSDEIQSSAGGVHLECMFVDEGFGSLDEETLQLALRSLTGLAGGQRLVGIISHVGELKQRIDRQIVVTKNKTGGSRAHIIA